ncbi:MAG: hypothetical protein WBA99_10950, partial [Nodosilinea sp.]
MKAIQEFVAAVERWWTVEKQAIKSIGPRPTLVPRSTSLEPAQASDRPLAASPAQPVPLHRGRPQPCRPRRRRKNIRHPRLVFVVTALSLTAILGQRFYNQPGLQVGSVAPNTIFAPDNIRVEDKETTEERRRDARNGALQVLRVEPTTDEAVLRSLDSLLAQVGDIRRQAGNVPFVSTGILSTQVQQYLRRSDDATWLKLRSLIDPLAKDNARNERIALE